MSARPAISQVASDEVIAQVIALDVEQIDPDWSGRIGQFFPLKVEGLAARIGEDGQTNPIWVARAPARAKLPWRLVAGLHRLEACRRLGSPVAAIVVEGDDAELRRLQAGENLDPREMTVLERSMFIAAIAEAAQLRIKRQFGDTSPQALGGKAKAAGSKSLPPAPVRASDQMDAADADAAAAMDNLSIAYSWKAEVAEASGLGEKAVQRAMRIFRGIVEPHRQLVDGIKDHPVADNASSLLLLAGKPAPLRAAVLEWLAEHPQAKTIDEAIRGLGHAASKGSRAADAEHGQTKLLTRAESNLKELSVAVWRSWAPAFAAQVKPAALLAVRDALDARIAELRATGKLEDKS